METQKPSGSAPAAGELIRRIGRILPQAMLRDREIAGRRLQAIIDRNRRITDRASERPGLRLDQQAADRAEGRPGRHLQEKHGLALSGPASRISPYPILTQSLLDELAALETRLIDSARERESRSRRRPPLHFPFDLPITARRNDIVRAIRSRQVVIISGETGCGKSTQIPKMCLEASRGVAGKIACTQPRRIAAVTIAHRIADEMGEPLGRSVGYKIRFQDRTPREAYVKIMTDGMLLAETQSDPRLMEYDTLIIDEAHERSLNIDFLLGIARTLLDARPELKLIITSATLDTEKFSRAFDGAPVIEVSGRMFPVDIEYWPPETFPGGKEEADYLDMAVHAVDRIKTRKPCGDILVFMPTEQDILESCARLEGKRYPGTTILPLYARLPSAQQGRVYSVEGAKIVVATNVAETSLTIPGIKYVVDTGLARIAQYQPGTRINSLPVSPVSRSSADQRAGRCGRVQAGVCIRLYSREDYEERPQFTPPEILRSNLAEVILRMIDLKLGDPLAFPFVDRPNAKNVKDGYETLIELGAIEREGRDVALTPRGRRMARMPLDPRLSRLLLEAAEEGCLAETAVIAAALSIRDPRERPPDQTEAADAAHALFRHPESDFLSLLALWNRANAERVKGASASRLKKFCHEHFLSFTRMREWGFVHDQILSILEEQKIAPREKKRDGHFDLYAAIHRSILSGFLSNIAALKEKNIYQAAKGREVMIFPGSTLFNKARPWITAAEMVETSRLYARQAAKIDPDWIEAIGGDLCRYSWSEPRWEKERGEVRAKERVTLFGLVIVADRPVSFGRVNPEEAHRIFVRSALVEGDVAEPPPYLEHNRGLIERAETMEDKLRRRDILVREDALADFYSRRLPGVYDLRTMEKKIEDMGGDGFLRMSEKDLFQFFPDENELAGFPDRLAVGDRRFSAAYKFAPGEAEDGVTLKIPAGLIQHVPAEPLEWGVPGRFKEKIEGLIKGLPKASRKLLVPAAEKAEVIAREMKRTDASLFNSLAVFVRQRFKVDIPAAEWAAAEIPGYLRMRIAVTDRDGGVIATGRDIEELRKAGLGAGVPEDSAGWKAAREKWERMGLKFWDFGSLPESVPAGPWTDAFPGLEATDGSSNLRLFKTKEEARASHERGVEALLLIKFARDLEFMKRYLPLPVEHNSVALHFGGRADVERAMLENLRRQVFRKNLRTKEEFDLYSGTIVRGLFEKGHILRETTLRILAAYQKARAALRSIEKAHLKGGPVASICATIREELERLVPSQFLDIYPLERLSHLPRYIEAMEFRAERAKNSPEKDRAKSSQIAPFAEALKKMEADMAAAEAVPRAGETDKRESKTFPKRIGELSQAAKQPESPTPGLRVKSAGGVPHNRQTSPPPVSAEKRRAIEEFRSMIEEFKVALFAPELKTAFPVSPKRLAEKVRGIEALI